MQSNHEAPEPNDGVVKILEKRPLKSATSVVYAAQLAGYSRHGLDEYMNVDLDFLNRYAVRFLPAIVGDELADEVQSRLHELGIAPMNEDDLENLMSVAQIFIPQNVRTA